jgi:hypothetical protein
MFNESFFSETAFKIAFYYISELALLLITGILGLISTRGRSITN